MISVGQDIPLVATIRDKDGIVDLSVGWTVRIDYWLSSNKTILPSSFVNGVIDDPENGLISGLIPAIINVEAGFWRFQLVAIDSEGKEWPAKTFTKIIYDRGK